MLGDLSMSLSYVRCQRPTLFTRDCQQLPATLAGHAIRSTRKNTAQDIGLCGDDQNTVRERKYGTIRSAMKHYLFACSNSNFGSAVNL